MAKRDNCEPITNSLEKLLNQLKKCEQAASKEQYCKKSSTENEVKEQIKKENERKEDKEKEPMEGERAYPNLKSFNYRDISSNLTKPKSDPKNVSESNSIQDLTRKMNSSFSNGSKQMCSKPTLDDQCALELHRSKSYIVNLIDRALSKELGTVPSSRNQKAFENMNPRRAIELMNRHVGKADGDVEVGSESITGSDFSNYIIQDRIEDDNGSQTKICSCTMEEPGYIKQLKQLRWGHLKHIQHEVKRLEDLERFLDSCSITTIPEL